MSSCLFVYFFPIPIIYASNIVPNGKTKSTWITRVYDNGNTNKDTVAKKKTRVKNKNITNSKYLTATCHFYHERTTYFIFCFSSYTCMLFFLYKCSLLYNIRKTSKNFWRKKKIKICEGTEKGKNDIIHRMLWYCLFFPSFSIDFSFIRILFRYFFSRLFFIFFSSRVIQKNFITISIS